MGDGWGIECVASSKKPLSLLSNIAAILPCGYMEPAIFRLGHKNRDLAARRRLEWKVPRPGEWWICRRDQLLGTGDGPSPGICNGRNRYRTHRLRVHGPERIICDRAPGKSKRLWLACDPRDDI